MTVRAGSPLSKSWSFRKTLYADLRCDDSAFQKRESGDATSGICTLSPLLCSHVYLGMLAGEPWSGGLPPATPRLCCGPCEIEMGDNDFTHEDNRCEATRFARDLEDVVQGPTRFETLSANSSFAFPVLPFIV